MITGYHYKFYLNANHAIYLNGQLGQIHPHTWEFSFEVINENELASVGWYISYF